MSTRNLTKRFNDIKSGYKATRALDMDTGSSGGFGVTRRRAGSTDSEHSAHEGDAHYKDALLNGGSSSSGAGGVGSNVQDSLPPLWVDMIAEAEHDIMKIHNRMKDLTSLHTKRLMVNFESDEASQEAAVEAKTSEITRLFRHTEGILKRFSAVGAGTDSDGHQIPLSQAELAVRNNIQRNFAKRLQTLTVQFRSSQKDYMTKLKVQKSGPSSLSNIFDEHGGSAAAGGGLVDTGFTSEQMRMVDDTERLVNERDQEITNLAKNIEELAAIFKELAAMVIDQGTILDRIDYNMEQTIEQTKEGIKQLEHAEESQKNSLSVKCIILLCVLIAVFIIVLIAKHSGKN